MTNKHYENLGRIADNFQSLEFAIAASIWNVLSDDPEIGKMVTCLLPFGKLCVLANSLYQHKFGSTPYADRLTALIKRCLILEEKRNQFFHSVWLSSRGRPRAVRRMKIGAKFDKGLVTSVHDVSSAEIGEVADNMRTVFDEFSRLWVEMHEEGTSTE